MKMNVATQLPEDYVVSHQDLAETAASLIAHALLPLFAENMSEDIAKANVEGIVTELAYLFDEGEITLGGKRYRPRIAFVDESGQILPGAADLVTLHELVGEPFNISPDLGVTFEAPELVEE